MGCYKCGSDEGSEVILCPHCREERKKLDISVQNSVNGKREGVRPYLQLVREEWHIAIGTIVMILVGLKGAWWLLFSQTVIFDPTGLSGPNGPELYRQCMEKLVNTPLVDVDQTALVESYRDQMEHYAEYQAVSGLAPEDDSPMPTDPVQFALTLRAREACSGARSACEANPNGEECLNLVKVYIFSK